MNLILSVLSIILAYFVFLFIIVCSVHRITVRQKDLEAKATKIYSMKYNLRELRKNLRMIRLELDLYVGMKKNKTFKNLLNRKKECIKQIHNLREDILLFECGVKTI